MTGSLECCKSRYVEWEFHCRWIFIICKTDEDQRTGKEIIGISKQIFFCYSPSSPRSPCFLKVHSFASDVIFSAPTSLPLALAFVCCGARQTSQLQTILFLTIRKMFKKYCWVFPLKFYSSDLTSSTKHL